MNTYSRATVIQGLRELAEFLEANPAVPEPQLMVEFTDEAKFRTMLGAIENMPHKRETNHPWFTVRFNLPNSMQYSVSMDIPGPVAPPTPRWPEPIRPEPCLSCGESPCRNTSSECEGKRISLAPPEAQEVQP